MAKILTLSVPNGTETITLTSDMYVESWKQVECYFKDLKPADSYISFNIPYNQTIAETLLTHGDEDIKAVISDGTEIVYTGYLRKTYSLTKTQNNQPIALEIRSPAYKLETEIETDVCLESKTVLYIINYLLQQSGFYSADRTAEQIGTTEDIQSALTDTIDIAVFSEGDQIDKILEQLSFEIGTVYNFDKNGNFCLYPLFDEVSSAHTFSENNMYKEVQVTKKEQEADSINLKWYTKKYIEDAVIFADTQSGDTDNSCKITVAAGEYLYGTETNKCEYDSEEGSVIWADSAELAIKGISNTYEASNKGTYLSLSYKNETQYDQTITKLEVTGNAWVQVEGENNTKSINGKKTKDFEIKYLNSESKIQTLAQTLAQYYKYQDFTVKVYSYDDVAIGSFATVTAEGIGTIVARVIQKNTSAKKTYYEYTLEAAKEYDTVVVETKKQKQASPYYNLQKQINDTNEQISDIESNFLLMLFKRASQKPSSAGISGTGTYNFNTGVITWDEGSDSNGWVQIQNLEDGTDPLYMVAVYVSGKGSVSISDSQWSAPVLYVKNGENGENSTNSYYIIPNYNIITRYKNGTLSADTVTFDFYQGNDSSRGAVSLYYVLKKRTANGDWAQVAADTGSSVSYTLTNEDSLHCEIYLNSASSIPLDTQTVSVVNEGSDSITVTLSNPTAFVTVDQEKDTVNYNDTNTEVYVFSGATYLNYGDPNEPGNFDLDIKYANCGADGSSSVNYSGYIVDENDEKYFDENGEYYTTVGSFSLPELNSMDADAAVRRITVRGTSYGGDYFSFEIQQTFKKVYQAENGKNVTLQKIEYAVSSTSESVPSEWSETMPTDVEQGQYLWSKKTYYNEASETTYSEYAYTYKAYDGQQGLQGIQGEKGEQGIQGESGENSYFHIKYSAVADPTDADITETPSEYIGTYVDHTEADSTSAAKYTWSRFKGVQGDKGDQGIPGVDGDDGETSYLHIAYANSSDGKTDFSVSDSTNKLYIGQYTDHTSADSTDPTKYKWSLIKGDKGDAGDDGSGGMAVVLYQRSKTQPELPTAELTFTLANPPVLTWGKTGSSSGWVYDKPAVTSAKLPLWQITAAATFAGDSKTDRIQASEWHLDGIVQLDNGLTEDETQSLIDESISEYDEEVPKFSYSVDKYSFTTDINYIPQITQTMKVSLSCTRNGSAVGFEITEVSCPDTLEYIIANTDVYFTTKAGVKLSADKIQIKVKLSEEYYQSLVVDENGSAYVDENSEPYGQIVYYDEAIAQQTIEIPFNVVKGENNLGPVKTVAALPSDALIGDYIVWIGQTTKSDKSENGIFKTCAVYKYNGSFWAVDTDKGHNTDELDNILSIAEEDLNKNDESLAENNSWAYTWLDHLTANSIFTDKLIANEAFIKKFMSQEITLGYTDDSGNKHNGSIQSLDYDEESGTGWKVDSEGNAEFNGGKFKGTIIAEALQIGSGVKIGTDNISGLSGVATSGSYDDLLDKPTIPTVPSTVSDYQKIYKLVVKNTDGSYTTPAAPSTWIAANVTATTSVWGTVKASPADGQLLFSCTQFKKYSDTNIYNTVIGVDSDTVIDTKNGYLRTNLIDVKTLTAIEGFFDNIEIKNTATFDVVELEAGDNEIISFELYYTTSRGPVLPSNAAPSFEIKFPFSGKIRIKVTDYNSYATTDFIKIYKNDYFYDPEEIAIFNADGSADIEVNPDFSYTIGVNSALRISATVSICDSLPVKSFHNILSGILIKQSATTGEPIS